MIPSRRQRRHALRRRPSWRRLSRRRFRRRRRLLGVVSDVDFRVVRV